MQDPIKCGLSEEVSTQKGTAGRRMGEAANGRTGEARIRAPGSMSLRRFLRPGERIGLMRCVAASPSRLLPPSDMQAVEPRAFWCLLPGVL